MVQKVRLPEKEAIGLLPKISHYLTLTYLDISPLHQPEGGNTNVNLILTIDQSSNQSKGICIAPPTNSGQRRLTIKQ